MDTEYLPGKLKKKILKDSKKQFLREQVNTVIDKKIPLFEMQG